MCHIKYLSRVISFSVLVFGLASCSSDDNQMEVQYVKDKFNVPFPSIVLSVKKGSQSFFQAQPSLNIGEAHPSDYFDFSEARDQLGSGFKKVKVKIHSFCNSDKTKKPILNDYEFNLSQKIEFFKLIPPRLLLTVGESSANRLDCRFEMNFRNSFGSTVGPIRASVDRFIWKSPVPGVIPFKTTRSGLLEKLNQYGLPEFSLESLSTVRLEEISELASMLKLYCNDYEVDRLKQTQESEVYLNSFKLDQAKAHVQVHQNVAYQFYKQNCLILAYSTNGVIGLSNPFKLNLPAPKLGFTLEKVALGNGTYQEGQTYKPYFKWSISNPEKFPVTVSIPRQTPFRVTVKVARGERNDYHEKVMPGYLTYSHTTNHLGASTSSGGIVDSSRVAFTAVIPPKGKLHWRVSTSVVVHCTLEELFEVLIGHQMGDLPGSGMNSVNIKTPSKGFQFSPNYPYPWAFDILKGNDWSMPLTTIAIPRIHVKGWVGAPGVSEVPLGQPVHICRYIEP